MNIGLDPKLHHTISFSADTPADLTLVLEDEEGPFSITYGEVLALAQEQEAVTRYRQQLSVPKFVESVLKNAMYTPKRTYKIDEMKVTVFPPPRPTALSGTFCVLFQGEDLSLMKLRPWFEAMNAAGLSFLEIPNRSEQAVEYLLSRI